MPAGRPLKYGNIKKLQADIDAFFKECDDKEEPYTITGLALALGTYRQTLINYEGKPEFMDTIKMAKQRCENFAERRLYGQGQQAGPIFALKNYGWEDKQGHEVGGKMEIVITRTIIEGGAK
jgi:hypothetical protein